MTSQELKDKAYSVATGNSLTEIFDFNQFQEVNVMNYVWEPFEYWSEDMLSSYITQIADDIIRAFEYLVKDN